MGIEILLVEDNPGDVRLTREAFRSVNPYIRVSVARDGAEALTFLHQTGAHTQAPRPDLVLIDLNLPKLKGHEVLAHMKGDAHLKSIPVVILTTSTNPVDIATSYELQANSYLKKPEEWQAFEKLVRSLNDFWITHAILPGYKEGK
jgi:chemotaxis family two-component system response regulator Rcp1